MDRAAVRLRHARAASVARRVATILAVSVLVWWAVGAHHYWDLQVYRGAVRWWLDGGDLYAYIMSAENPFGFTYPPFAAIVMLPAAWIPLPVVEAGSVLATVAALVVTIDSLVSAAGGRFTMPRRRLVTLLTLPALALDASQQTLALGQIDMLLLVLVTWDLLVLPRAVGPVRRWAGVGIGLAAAIKLTPAVYVVYLVAVGRRRQAAVATATFAAASAAAFAVAPRESWTYWTRTMWQADRVGQVGSGGNQSVRGLLARVDPSSGAMPWLAAVTVLGVIWWLRARRAARLGDELGGFALTGAYACLIEPIAWVHHGVFLIPALVVIAGWATEGGWRPVRLVVAGSCYGVLVSRMYAYVQADHGVVLLVVGSAYAWVAFALLAFLPLRPPAGRQVVPATPVVTAREPDRRADP